jgi:hypothetical protein
LKQTAFDAKGTAKEQQTIKNRLFEREKKLKQVK